MKGDQKYRHGFNVPDGYFEDLENSLNYRLMEDEIPSSNGFVVPDNYFDGLEDSIGATLKNLESGNKQTVISLWPRRFGYAIGIAASLLIGWIVFAPKDSVTLEELPIANVEQYIQNGSLDIDWYDVAQLLTESDMENFSAGLQFEEEQLESYLIEHLDEATLFLE